MAFWKHKWWHAGVTLYMVLAPAFNALNMPCWADPAAASVEAEDDDEDVDESPAATQMRIEFIRGFNSALVLEGQSVVARLMDDWRLDNGSLMAPKGSKIYGRIESIKRSKSLIKSARTKGDRWNRHASVLLRFDKIVTKQKAKLEITGTPSPQYNVFSNGETIRIVVVGGEGELVKTSDTNMAGLPEFGLTLPHDWIKMRGRYDVEIRPGDEMLVHLELGGHRDVQGELVGGKEKKTD